MENAEWITLEYLEWYCQQKQLAISCKLGEQELWITSLGPHPSLLDAQEVEGILKQSSSFEIFQMVTGYSPAPQKISRSELAQRIRKMLN
ncbi:MAG: hypothetical protein HY645_02360 [Acidobacteria bacterium]|nr:hypothetical protein [Acidobacteriota bacterium]